MTLAARRPISVFSGSKCWHLLGSLWGLPPVATGGRECVLEALLENKDFFSEGVPVVIRLEYYLMSASRSSRRRL